MSQHMDYQRAYKIARIPHRIAEHKLLRTCMTAATFREDPLPDRPMKARRNVTLPSIPCLDRPIRNYLDD